MVPPCKVCEANNQPNCGNSWCHTNQKDLYEWVVDCSSCGTKSISTWKQAIEDGCQECCSYKTSIYSKKNL
jgi:hypothetical protein